MNSACATCYDAHKYERVAPQTPLVQHMHPVRVFVSPDWFAVQGHQR